MFNRGIIFGICLKAHLYEAYKMTQNYFYFQCVVLQYNIITAKDISTILLFTSHATCGNRLVICISLREKRAIHFIFIHKHSDKP